MTYFSEREEGDRPQNDEEIGERAWDGIRALIRARLEDGSFGASYPESCPDGLGPVGTDETSFRQAMLAEIPALPDWPWGVVAEERPRTLDILDMTEFCWRLVGKPFQGSYHSFFDHHHLRFEIDAGRTEFAEALNRIFRRNGLAYELTKTGSIERLAPPVLREALESAEFRTGDAELDRMLETGRRKFLNPDEAVRREALEALWDAWERLKTLDSGADKKEQTKALLDTTATSSSPKLREALGREAKELTQIGNSLQIRHSETTQERLAATEHVDYLFHRLLAFIQMVLRMTGRA